MLKIFAEYDRDTSPAKLKNISIFLTRFVPASLLGISAGICQ
jgi:hypothetical protein